MSSEKKRIALITGGNSGIGEVTARELARQGFTVYVACRSSAKTTQALTRLKADSGSTEIYHLELDLGCFDSVRACASTFLSQESHLDVLINNAGLAGQMGLTKSGFEMTFGVCHMGHFLLTQLLMKALKSSEEARVINVASMMHRLGGSMDLAQQTLPTSSVGGLKEYGVAKLANILFTKSLAEKLTGSNVTAYSLHPGAVATDVYRSLPKLFQPLIKLFMLTPEQGAQTTLFLASAPVNELQNGEYYVNSKPAKTSSQGSDKALAEKLWLQSEKWVAGVN